MTKAPNEDRQLGRVRASSGQTYARIAGILLLLSLFAGGFGEGLRSVQAHRVIRRDRHCAKPQSF
jgi:hypothetical protein